MKVETLPGTMHWSKRWLLRGSLLTYTSLCIAVWFVYILFLRQFINIIFVGNATNGNFGLARTLLCLGADINFRDNNRTALMFAVERNNISGVKFLVKQGANVNVGYIGKDDDHETVLLRAVGEHFYEIVDILAKRGADVNARSDTGKTMLYYASQDSDRKMIQILKRYGAHL